MRPPRSEYSAAWGGSHEIAPPQLTPVHGGTLSAHHASCMQCQGRGNDKQEGGGVGKSASPVRSLLYELGRWKQPWRQDAFTDAGLGNRIQC